MSYKSTGIGIIVGLGIALAIGAKDWNENSEKDRPLAANEVGRYVPLTQIKVGDRIIDSEKTKGASPTNVYFQFNEDVPEQVPWDLQEWVEAFVLDTATGQICMHQTVSFGQTPPKTDYSVWCTPALPENIDPGLTIFRDPQSEGGIRTGSTATQSNGVDSVVKP